MLGPKPGVGQDAQAAKPGLPPGPEPRLGMRVSEALRPGPGSGPKPSVSLRVHKLLRPGPLLWPQPEERGSKAGAGNAEGGECPQAPAPGASSRPEPRGAVGRGPKESTDCPGGRLITKARRARAAWPNLMDKGTVTGARRVGRAGAEAIAIEPARSNEITEGAGGSSPGAHPSRCAKIAPPVCGRSLAINDEASGNAHTTPPLGQPARGGAKPAPGASNDREALTDHMVVFSFPGDQGEGDVGRSQGRAAGVNQMAPLLTQERSAPAGGAREDKNSWRRCNHRKAMDAQRQGNWSF